MFLPRVDAAVERVSAVNLSNPLEGHERILLVEDSLPVRKIAQTALEHYGYSVVVPGDSSEACRMFERAPNDFDAVVTDIVMPKMDGRTLVETLRRIRPELRVLFVSGYTETAVVHPSERDDRTALPGQAVHARGAGAQPAAPARRRVAGARGAGLALGRRVRHAGP
jgi:CheY-like chemotaxis protein